MLPICVRPGCGKRVKECRRIYCCRECIRLHGLVSTVLRDKQRHQLALRRAMRFRAVIARLPAKLTGDDLLWLCQEVFERGYNTGWRVRHQRALSQAKAREAA